MKGGASIQDVGESHIDVDPISLEVNNKGYGVVKKTLRKAIHVSLIDWIQKWASLWISARKLKRSRIITSDHNNCLKFWIFGKAYGHWNKNPNICIILVNLVPLWDNVETS